jgi:hypothetical protein
MLKEVLDFDTYYLNLSAIPAVNHTSPVWQKLYSARREYSLPSLTPNDWHELSEQVRVNETLYSKFLKNYVRRDDFTCTPQCKRDLLCSLRKGHHNASALCGERMAVKGLEQ